MSSAKDDKPWRFVTNHTQVLLCIAADPHVRLRDVAETVGITERTTQRIVVDLVEAGYVRRTRWAGGTGTTSTARAGCGTPRSSSTRSASSWTCCDWRTDR